MKNAWGLTWVKPRIHKNGKRIWGSPVRRGVAYTYHNEDGTIDVDSEVVERMDYDQIQRYAIYQGHVKIHELEALLITALGGRVINWGIW